MESYTTKDNHNHSHTGKLREQAHAIADTIKEQGQEKAGVVADIICSNAQSGLTQTKNRAADSLTSLSQTLQEICQKLQAQGLSPISGYVHQSHQAVDRLSNHLRSHEVSELVREVEDYARHNPTMFITGVFTGGFLAGRFFRSSARVSRNRALVPYTLPAPASLPIPSEQRP